MSLFPLSKIHRVRPVAAADYFLANKIIAWLSRNLIGIIPLDRSGKASRDSLFSGCQEALDRGDILLVFPEGSRGKPEELSRLRKGIYYVVKDRPDTRVTPVVMRGLGKALPKGEALFVPFNCDVIIGETLETDPSSEAFMDQLNTSYRSLLAHCLTR